MALNRESVVRFLVEKQGIDAADLENGVLLFTGGLLDSFTMVDLIQFIEEEGGFTLHPSDANLDNLDSINRILAYAESRG